jgi:hypothetical protein
MAGLRINFEGYWQCRQATDPDPSDEPRGVSGYTFAVGHENDLDQVIYLQRDQIPDADFREPHTEGFGVFVTGAEIVQAGAQPGPLGPNLGRGAKVYLRPSERDPTKGPKFELRNEIIFHELQGIIMPICPFNLEIVGDGWKLRREDPLDINDPSLEVWQMIEGYARRSPKNFYSVSDEVLQAIGIAPAPDYPTAFTDYFQRRKQWLNLKLAETNDPVEVEGYKTRIWAIDFNTQDQRMESRLGLQAIWDFEIRGKTPDVTGADHFFGGTIDAETFWRTHFWFGGFDGDLMRGYMRGFLEVPFTPANPRTT